MNEIINSQNIEKIVKKLKYLKMIQMDLLNGPLIQFEIKQYC